MTFNDNQKEIIRAIVKYGDKTKSLAEVINKSRLFEKRGIVIAFGSNRNYVFFDKAKYDWDDKNVYIEEFISLLKDLNSNRLITLFPKDVRDILVLGRDNSWWGRRGYIEVDDAIIDVESHMGDWVDKTTRQQTYWSNCFSEQELPISRYLDCLFTVSQELKDLVKHDFKTEDQIRFDKQQWFTWISIGVTVLSIIIAILK